ncbi:MAG: hypothetical protein DME99_03755 [Verrucomicrobia bacterium]|nr:MAG: hypothetical protein DME99_03755 [Verrucomicrobiota bacterium]
MPHETVWIQESRVLFPRRRISRGNCASLYCTVTSVPIGISEKNLRAASGGSLIHPWDAG